MYKLISIVLLLVMVSVPMARAADRDWENALGIVIAGGIIWGLMDGADDHHASPPNRYGPPQPPNRHCGPPPPPYWNSGPMPPPCWGYVPVTPPGFGYRPPQPPFHGSVTPLPPSWHGQVPPQYQHRDPDRRDGRPTVGRLWTR